MKNTIRCKFPFFNRNTDIALIKNNAKAASEIAVELSKLEKRNLKPSRHDKDGKPMVIGGSNLDWSVKLESAEIKLDGRIHYGKYAMSAGGVARNICEALSKLECSPNFISVLGSDPQGQILRNLIPGQCLDLVRTLKGHTTGQCTVVFDPDGECKLLLGDMEIHREITPEMIKENETVIKKAPLIVFDGNLTVSTIDTILELAEKYSIPAFFEPTDVEISRKPFETNHWKAVKFITPNLHELRYVASYLNIPREERYENKIDEIVDIAKKLVDYIDNVIVTLGPDGLIIARKGKATDSFLISKEENASVRHYPAKKIKNVVNVSGAGDSLASGMIAALLNGLSEEESVSVGFAAAQTALFSLSPIAERLFDRNHDAWKSKASYITKV